MNIPKHHKGSDVKPVYCQHALQAIEEVADVIRQHRAEHAHTVLIAACQEAIRTGAIVPILERFITWPLAA